MIILTIVINTKLAANNRMTFIANLSTAPVLFEFKLFRK